MPAWPAGPACTSESTPVYSDPDSINWKTLWEGSVNTSDDWFLTLFSHDTAELIRWKVSSQSRRKQAMVTLDRRGMLASGMDPRLKISQLSLKAAKLCQSGRILVNGKIDGSETVLLTLSEQVDGSGDQLFEYTFTLVGLIRPHLSGSLYPSTISLPSESMKIVQLETEIQNKEREIQRLCSELIKAKDQASNATRKLEISEHRLMEMNELVSILQQGKHAVMSGSDDRREGDPMGRMHKNQPEWKKYEVNSISLLKMTEEISELRHWLELSEQERAHLMSEVVRLTNDLGEEVEKRESIQKDWEELAVEVLEKGLHEWHDCLKQRSWSSKGERDEKGNPLFIRKMDDYRRKGRIIDEMQAKFLYRNRKRVRADAEYSWKGQSGETRRGNAIYFCAGFPRLCSMLDWLLKDGSIDQNEHTSDKWKSTPLMNAAMRGNFVAAQMLLRDPTVAKNARNAVDATPLIHAAAHNQPAMVRLLLEHGCNPTLKEKIGERTALQIAREKGYLEVISILESVSS